MTTTPGGARWIVLTPTLQDGPWRQALAKATFEAGLTLAYASPASPPEALADPGTIMVTSDSSLASGVHPEHVVALLPNPEQSAAATAAQFDLPPHQDLWYASRLLAHACDIPGGHQVLGMDAIQAAAGRLQIFPDLTLCPPQAQAPAASTSAASQALAIYRNGRPRTGEAAVWDPSLFIYDERAVGGLAPSGEIDVTGRPRTLVYGPNVSLPAGLWRATVRFSVDQDACYRSFRLDWGAGTDFTTHTVIPGAAGIFEIEIEHWFPAPAVTQIRILIMEGAFSGALTLLGSAVKRLDDASTGPPEGTV